MSFLLGLKDKWVAAGVSVPGCELGSSDFDKIFENCFASCSFELAKDI